MRLATRSSVAGVNATQAYYRRHDANMSTAYMKNPLSDLREQLDHGQEGRRRGRGSSSAAEGDGGDEGPVSSSRPAGGWLAVSAGDEDGGENLLEFASQNSAALWRSFRLARLPGQAPHRGDTLMREMRPRRGEEGCRIHAIPGGVDVRLVAG